MSVARLFLHMFLRKLPNRSGSYSIQIISKYRGRYKVIKTIGSGISEQEIEKLMFLGNQEIERLEGQSKLFISEKDSAIDNIFSSLHNSSVQTIGPELIFGKIMTSLVLTR